MSANFFAYDECSNCDRIPEPGARVRRHPPLDDDIRTIAAPSGR